MKRNILLKDNYLDWKLSNGNFLNLDKYLLKKNNKTIEKEKIDNEKVFYRNLPKLKGYLNVNSLSRVNIYKYI